LVFVVPGPPVPQERSRKGGAGHWYIPTKSIRWREAVVWAARRALGTLGPWPTRAKLYRVKVDCYFPDLRTRDAVNVACNLLDALGTQRVKKRNGVIVRPAIPGLLWHNDKSCAANATPYLDRVNPRTEVVVEVVS
jgi:Holliday junction resolvase RusA-like endonuclease